MSDIRTPAEIHAAQCRVMRYRAPLGSVRRCPHGTIQESVVVTSAHAQWSAWRDLHFLVAPFRWRRARRALQDSR